MEDLRDKRVTVVGLGKSGLAAAELCFSRGAKVTLNDSKDSVTGLVPLLTRGAVSALGGHSGKGIEESDLGCHLTSGIRGPRRSPRASAGHSRWNQCGADPLVGKYLWAV